MTRRLKVGAGAAIVLIVYGVAIWFLVSWWGLSGSDRWILRGGLWLLGAVAILAVAWWLWRPRVRPLVTEQESGSEVDAAFAAAGARLKAARMAGAGSLERLPMVLVMGPEGSAKTTIIVRSGLEPDLLAGEALRGEMVAPTSVVNLWYSQQAILVEPGGRLAGDPVRWGRVVRHLAPERLGSAVWGAPQPPRIALVCFSCEEFLRANRGDAVPAAARALRARIAEVAGGLGIRLPVYVVFTKADRIPHFAEYVRNFSRDEVREVFGATLPLARPTGESYAEQAFARIDATLQRQFRSLAEKRLKFMPREAVTETAASAYEFPREFRKIVPQATQFLIELCRPTQLEISPVLRGFYFTGVRPIYINEGPREAMAPAVMAGEAAPVGATSVFDPAAGRGGGPRYAATAGTAGAAAPAPAARKVPQWVFLERLFPEVLLADGAAAGLARGSRRVDGLRRVLAGSAIVVSAAAALGFTVSYLGNRELQRSVVAVERELASVPAGEGPLPSADALGRLDAARAELVTLTGYEVDGPPWHLRWGLYAGGPLYQSLRGRYYAGFERLMFAAARDSLRTALGRLPDSPARSIDYGTAYNGLKAYLITAVRPDQSTPAFLAPVLLDRWRGSATLDPVRANLARAQFSFYAAELPYGNPYPAPPDTAAILRARAFLGQFTGAEPIYRAMLSEVSAGVQPVQFERRFPGATAVVRDPYVVPGPFTRAGWTAMQAALKDADRFFAGESWVLGAERAAPADRGAVLARLRATYRRDYITHWRNFLSSASVLPFTGVAEGARRLGSLSGNQSPLLALFALAARNTAVDSQVVRPAFQPVQLVTPPGDSTKYIAGSNEAYVNALVTLQSSVEQIARGASDDQDAAGRALGDAAQARLATRQLANKFQVDQEASIHRVVQRLLEAPILYAEATLRAAGPAQLNGKGKAFCAPFQRILAKYPFDRYSGTLADFDEVSALFQPGSGAMWSFVETDLASYVVPQGPRFAEKPGSPARISPPFLAFLNRAAEFSHALYQRDAGGPRLTFTMRPRLSDDVPSLTVTVGGRPARFTRNSVATQQIVWAGSDLQEASLAGRMGGREREAYSVRGPWALFHLFGQANWSTAEGYNRVEWPLPGRAADGTPLKAEFEVNFGGAKPVLRPDFFAGVSCSGRIAR